MAIYAIADLHLSFAENKPMDIFGVNWTKHEEKIEENWKNVVSENDLVLLPGDFSWAMALENTLLDFKFLNKLPGKKILLKGNHDYWWATVSKTKKFLESNNIENIDFLYNNSFLFDNTIICGTRGWTEQEKDADKIIKRENARLENSLRKGTEQFGDKKDIIVCMHYPPFTSNNEFLDTMKKYNVKKCIYGHLHGTEAQNLAKQGIIQGIEFKLVSSDYLGFKLVKV